METNEKFSERVARSIENVSLPERYLKTRGKTKSVRTTITVSPGIVEIMTWLMQVQGLKPKDVMDTILVNESLVDGIVRVADDAKPGDETQSIRKSIVLSNSALRRLNDLAKRHGKSRDSLISTAFIFMEVILKKADKENRKKHKQALDIIGGAGSYFITVRGDLVKLLGENDPIVARWDLVYGFLENLHFAIESELEYGTPIEPDDYFQSS